jgi:glycosyltransferase involved in cell wall biosynthesis
MISFVSSTPNAVANSGPLVAFDARWTRTGLGTYSAGLLSRIRRYGSFRVRGLTFMEFVPEVAPCCDEVATVSSRMYSLAEQFEIPWAARGARLLHVPHYNAPILHAGPMVVTFHDLTHILDETYRRMPGSRLAAVLMHLVSRRADHIITVSEYSRRMIVERLHIPERKITVIPNGVGPQFVPADRDLARRQVNAALNFVGPYVLYVGSLKPHKNVEGLVDAFALVTRDRAIYHRLLILGDDPSGGPLLRRRVERTGLAARVDFVPRVPDELLPSVYAGADLTVLPSFEEGFGLPVVESMACGTPVACSSAASLPEAGGSAAMYFDPRKPEEIAAAIAGVLLTPRRSEELRGLGLEQAARFTWETSARRHVEVYSRFW